MVIVELLLSDPTTLRRCCQDGTLIFLETVRIRTGPSVRASEVTGAGNAVSSFPPRTATLLPSLRVSLQSRKENQGPCNALLDSHKSSYARDMRIMACRPAAWNMLIWLPADKIFWRSD